MISSLEDAQKLKERGHDVRIWREVSYYARVGNIEYALPHDWTIEELEDRLWRKSNESKDGSK